MNRAESPLKAEGHLDADPRTLPGAHAPENRQPMASVPVTGVAMSSPAAAAPIPVPAAMMDVTMVRAR